MTCRHVRNMTDLCTILKCRSLLILHTCAFKHGAVHRRKWHCSFMIQCSFLVVLSAQVSASLGFDLEDLKAHPLFKLIMGSLALLFLFLFCGGIAASQQVCLSVGDPACVPVPVRFQRESNLALPPCAFIWIVSPTCA